MTSRSVFFLYQQQSNLAYNMYEYKIFTEINTTMFVLFILFPGLTNFVVGDNDIVFNKSVLTSHYCFVNESTIRIKDSNV